MSRGAILRNICLLWLLMITASTATEYNFSIDSLEKQDPYHYSYPGLNTLTVNQYFSLPLFTVYIYDEGSENILVIPEATPTLALGKIPDSLKNAENPATYAAESPAVALAFPPEMGNCLYNIQKITLKGIPYLAVTILPVTVGPDGTLWLHTQINVNGIGISKDAVRQAALAGIFEGAAKAGEYERTQDETGIYGLPLDAEFVIVTTENLVPEYERLAEFKNAIGLSTGIALMDTVAVYYEGIDRAAQLRTYLTAFHSHGGRYVLIGGDDVNMPVRYLYYYNTSVPPTDPYVLMPSDLYFADLTGDWDKDGDGIWGEPTHDAPDIIPELVVGRVPLRQPGQVAAYVDKVIQYQTAPGRDDFSYLTKTLFFSSDQMRDYPEAGQHNYIAEAIPSYIEVDTTATVELPDGYSLRPTNPGGVESVDILSQGYGMVQIIAHGRIDGFRVRASRYGDWPYSNILTQEIGAGHGCIDSLPADGKTSLYYSLSCQVGGFDLDTLDGSPASFSFIEGILATPEKGAVGMVAYTRWGWVYSSYFLQKSFTGHLFNDAFGSAPRAMTLSWLDYPYYRDLIYGQNFYGDPTVMTYLTRPEKLKAEVLADSLGHFVEVFTSEGHLIEGARVCLSVAGNIIEEGLSDESGLYHIIDSLEYGIDYVITAVKESHTVARSIYTPSLVTDVEDDVDNLPTQFILGQNYPNPFNMSTAIQFSVPARGDADLEIFNILGQNVHSEVISCPGPGDYTVRWEAVDWHGRALPTGIYFYRLEMDGIAETRKMLLLK